MGAIMGAIQIEGLHYLAECAGNQRAMLMCKRAIEGDAVAIRYCKEWYYSTSNKMVLLSNQWFDLVKS